MSGENEKQTKLSDHIVKSIVQPISKKPSSQTVFTTEPKRHPRKGQYVVRDRCLEFIDILKEKGYTAEIPLKEAKVLFQLEMGIMDRTSLKAYFGSQRSTSRRRIRRIARYASGTVSIKDIELAQNIQEKKGYLETLRLATPMKKGETWFLMLQQQETLVPELKVNRECLEAANGVPTCEVSSVSIDGFSLTPKLSPRLSEHRMATSLKGAPEGTLETIEDLERHKQTTTNRVREKMGLEKEYSDSLT